MEAMTADVGALVASSASVAASTAARIGRRVLKTWLLHARMWILVWLLTTDLVDNAHVTLVQGVVEVVSACIRLLAHAE